MGKGPMMPREAEFPDPRYVQWPEVGRKGWVEESLDIERAPVRAGIGDDLTQCLSPGLTDRTEPENLRI